MKEIPSKGEGMDSRYPLLSSFKGPPDVRSLSETALGELASEIRRIIIDVISVNGGHLASNLGVVELTLALHAEFDSPTDKIVWDVGHQCYTHKLLTGRLDRFATIRRKGGLSGFPKRGESVHDPVETGHSSTSISASLGLLTGLRLSGRKGKVVAVIGDGALSGGMALEALNHAGHLGRDLVVVLNDNTMSISKNVGAISSYLSRMTSTKRYQDIRARIDKAVQNVPLYGDRLLDVVNRVKKGAKAVVFPDTLFTALGFDYVGPLDGHDIPLLREVFRNIRDLTRPVVVHVLTKKGKGYSHAEDNPTTYHGVPHFCVQDGMIEKSGAPSYTERFSAKLLSVGKEDPRVAAITAAMAGGTGLSSFQESFPDRFFDVGITEQHAVTFAAGLAAAGLRPVVAIYSTFMQRAVDQVYHDVALPNLGVMFAIDRAGLVGDDGETHQGLYDIQLFRSAPNLTILAPASGGELELMMDWAMALPGPSMLRFPKDACGPDLPELARPLEAGRGVFARRQGGEILILSLGGLLPGALEAAEILTGEGVPTDVYNLRFVKPLDRGFLAEVLRGYRAAYLVEDGARSGGVGEMLGSLVRETAPGLVYDHGGAPDAFLPQGGRNELLADCGLDAAGIASAVRELLDRTLLDAPLHFTRVV